MNDAGRFWLNGQGGGPRMRDAGHESYQDPDWRARHKEPPKTIREVNNGVSSWNFRFGNGVRFFTGREHRGMDRWWDFQGVIAAIGTDDKILYQRFEGQNSRNAPLRIACESSWRSR